MTNIPDDKLSLINFSIKVVNELLLENEEFYPIATSIDLNGETKPIMYFDGDENPLSEDLIAKYSEILETKIENSEIRAYSIAFDVRVTGNGDGEILDAIAIKIKHIEADEVTVYFYPYTLTQDRKLTLGDSWAEIQ